MGDLYHWAIGFFVFFFLGGGVLVFLGGGFLMAIFVMEILNPIFLFSQRIRDETQSMHSQNDAKLAVKV